MTGDDDTQMVLSNDFYCIMIGKNRNIGVGFYSLDEACLYFCAGIVFMVQDTELGMSSFFMWNLFLICESFR